MGEDHLQAVELVGLTDYHILKSELAIKALSGARVASSERIKTGLVLHELTRQTGREYDGMGEIVEDKKD